MSFCLSLFDVTGIQSFIFSSRKAQENIGGSLLVRDALDVHLIKSIQDVCNELGGEAVTGWRDAAVFRMGKSGAPLAEVIYIGGGKAMVAFRDEETAKKAARRFSRELMKAADGALGVAVAYLESSGDFENDNEALHKKLNENKFTLPNSAPVLGLGVTREGATDGRPAVKRGKEGQWISAQAQIKRDAAKADADSGSPFDDAFRRVLERGWKFPAEFDDLGRDVDRGESFIAVVHLDGNSMGGKIQNYVGKAGHDYDRAVANMREISKKISDTYKEVFASVLNDLADVFEKNENKWFRRLFVQRRGSALPVRPLIFAGDDVTFVCDGRVALDLAARFMEKLVKVEFDGTKPFFTACGGIALVKPHFPFFRAYELAESLCSSAKKACKAKGAANGCWIDYQIVYSGLPTELSEFRASKYSVPGMSSSGGFPLLWRPYCVTGAAGDGDKKRLWSAALSHLRLLTLGSGEQKPWPRSKLKGLREALCSGESETAQFLSEQESRGRTLPCPAFEDAGGARRSQWYDILELLDSYVQIPWEEASER